MHGDTQLETAGGERLAESLELLADMGRDFARSLDIELTLQSGFGIDRAVETGIGGHVANDFAGVVLHTAPDDAVIRAQDEAGDVGGTGLSSQ